NTRTMLFFNFLNRNITDEFQPLFEIICISEAFFLLVFPAVAIPILQAVWRTTSYHRNIRLHVVVFIIFALIYTLARIIILCHQYF
ncbi:hypothetical protein PMAYCL1PPCAC_15437, partial [Pristionchus mayeri]